VGVHNEENQTGFHCSKRYPSFFVFDRKIGLGHSVRIIEHDGGSLKRNAVFTTIDCILMLIPFQSHSRCQARVARHMLDVNTIVRIIVSRLGDKACL